MKLHFITTLFLILLIGCAKNKDIAEFNYNILDGCYIGQFVCHENTFWCEVCFKSNRFEEWPSGGALSQKSMGCLTVGSYSIIENRLIFKLDSFKFKNYPIACDSIMILPKEYKIINVIDSDSIIFESGSGNSVIKYYLKRLKE